MKRKFHLFTLSFVLFFSVLCFCSPFEHYVFANESSISNSDNSSTDNDSPGAGEILIIIGIFTVTAVSSALITYKIRKHNADKKDSDS